jgi:hypothetical protein
VGFGTIRLGDTLIFASAVWIGVVTAGVALVGGAATLAANAIELRLARRRAAAEAKSTSQDAAVPTAHVISSQQRRGNLPRRYRPFVNRDSELSEALDQICNGGESVLAFEGARGIGKSVAATELAHRLLDEPRPGTIDLREYEFVWVRGYSGSTTVADIGRSLSLETGDQSVAASAEIAKIDRLRAHLARRKTALVLDNLWLSTDADSEALRELLATVPEGSIVIAAVNRDEDLDAYSIPLDEFDLQDVRKLIDAQVERLKLEPVAQFDDELARRLYELVGGHPATITWFLRAYKGSSQTLDERMEALARGTGLDQLFATVWGYLGPRERALLAACESLGGRASIEQLAIACQVHDEEAASVAERLLGEGVLGVVRTADDSAFTCPRAFALFVSGETPLLVRYQYLQRLARHYVSSVTADPENALALRPHAETLRSLFDGLARQQVDGIEDPELEHDLQDLFKSTLDILLTLGLLDDRIAAARYAYESAIRTDQHRCASLACEVLAGTHALRGEFEAAESVLAHGWLAADRAEDVGEVARQMYCEAFLRYRSGDPQAALDALVGADEQALTANDLETAINVLDTRCAAQLYLGEVEHCRAEAEHCLALCEQIGWERAKTFPLRFLAEVSIQGGHLAHARELLERAELLAGTYGDRRQSVRVSITVARLRLLERDLDAAEVAATQAAQEAQELWLPPEEQEARALGHMVQLCRSSPATLQDYISRQPLRLTDAPIAGD